MLTSGDISESGTRNSYMKKFTCRPVLLETSQQVIVIDGGGKIERRGVSGEYAGDVTVESSHTVGRIIPAKTII